MGSVSCDVQVHGSTSWATRAIREYVEYGLFATLVLEMKFQHMGGVCFVLRACGVAFCFVGLDIYSERGPSLTTPS